MLGHGVELLQLTVGLRQSFSLGAAEAGIASVCKTCSQATASEPAS